MRKLVSLGLVVMCAAGWLSFGSSLISEQAQYARTLAAAREMAQRGVPYRSAQNFSAALSEKNQKSVYQEYLQELYKLNANDIYYDGLADYLQKFPDETDYYQALMQHYYDEDDSDSLMQLYHTAESNNALTDQMNAQYKETFYQLVNVAGGFSFAGNYMNQYALVQQGSQWGIINADGAYTVNCQYDAADYFLSNYFPASKDGQSWLMGFNGEIMMNPTQPLSRIWMVNDGVCVIEKDGKYAISDENLIVPDEFPYDMLSTSASGVMAAKKGEKWALIHTDGSQITDYVYDDIKIDPDWNICVKYGVIFAKQNGKYIMLDTSGKQIGTEQFDDAKMFASTQPTAIRQGEKWGFVNTDGTLNGDVQFDEIDAFSLSLYEAEENGKWGYRTANGEFVIAPQFDEAKPFAANGIAAVREGDTWRYITLKGFRQ